MRHLCELRPPHSKIVSPRSYGLWGFGYPAVPVIAAGTIAALSAVLVLV
jgi:hypothetical protein